MAKPSNKKFAIFVHQLPFDRFDDALAVLPKDGIEDVTHDDSGMRIYFKQWEVAKRCICKQSSIQVGGDSYTVSALQTQLTLHGVREYFTESAIREMMSLYGPVDELYTVRSIKKDGKSFRSFQLNDYRVILDVPEVLMDSSLDPVRVKNLSFRVSFFCRICRQDGHRCKDHSETALRNETASSSHEIPLRRQRLHQSSSSSDCSIAATRLNISPEEFEEEHNAGGSPYRAGFRQTKISATSPFAKSERTHSFISDDFQTEEDCSTCSENLRKRSFGKDRSATAHDKKRSSSVAIAPCTDARVNNPGHKKNKLPTKKTRKKKTKRKHILELSPGIAKIVSKSTGVLTPEKLHNFLKQVRGRKKQFDIAAKFTDDIPGLVRQLKAVEKDYYVHGKRGKREDMDIQFMKGMLGRLEQKYKENAAVETSRLTNPHVRSTNSRDESAVSENSTRKVAENSKKMNQSVFNTNSPKSAKKTLPEKRVKRNSGVSPPSNQLRGRKHFLPTTIQSNVKQRSMPAKKSVPGSTQTVSVDNSTNCTRRIAKKNLIDKNQSYRRRNTTLQRIKMKISDLKSKLDLENCPSTSKAFSRN